MKQNIRLEWLNKLRPILCIPAAACGCAALVRLCFCLRLTDVIHYRLYYSETTPAWLLPCAAAAGAVAGAFAAKKFAPVILPMLLLIPGFLFFQNSFAWLLLTVITAGIIGFQAGAHYPFPAAFFKKRT